MSSQVTIAVLGAAGLIGKRHIHHIIQNPRTCVHSVVDPTPDGARLASELGVALFASLDDLILSFTTSKPMAAIIATPTHLHVPQALELIRHGIHVLVEKPACHDIESGKKLLEAASLPTTGTVLVGYHRRFNPYIIALKSLLDSGRLGRVVAIQGTWAVRKPDEYFQQNPWRTLNGSGGPILTNMSHEIDLLQHLFGDITRVYLDLGPKLRGHEVEETGAITLRFASGTVGTFVFSDNALSPFSFEAATGENPELVSYSGGNVYRVLGSDGSVELPTLKRHFYDGQGAGNWSLPLAEDDALSPNKDPERFAYTDANAPFTKRLEHWVEVIENGAPVNCTLREGVLVNVILSALFESAEKGTAVDIETI